MVATYQEIQTERPIMTDIWEFRKKYYHGENEYEFWASMIREADDLCRRHKNNEFLCQMLLVCMGDTEDRWRKASGLDFYRKDPLKSVYESLQKRLQGRG